MGCNDLRQGEDTAVPAHVFLILLPPNHLDLARTYDVGCNDLRQGKDTAVPAHVFFEAMGFKKLTLVHVRNAGEETAAL